MTYNWNKYGQLSIGVESFEPDKFLCCPFCGAEIFSYQAGNPTTIRFIGQTVDEGGTLITASAPVAGECPVCGSPYRYDGEALLILVKLVEQTKQKVVRHMIS